MRIISGKFKGRRFQLPKNLKARPTTDFAKEGLFNVLNNLIDYKNIEILDLFAGTGSISLEFISRGVIKCTSIEGYMPHINFIRETSKKLGISNIRILKEDVYKYISSSDKKFDLIFADAPYADPKLPSIPELISQNNLLSDSGLLIVEHPKTISFNEMTNFKEERIYGNVHFSFFEK